MGYTELGFLTLCHARRVEAGPSGMELESIFVGFGIELGMELVEDLIDVISIEFGIKLGVNPKLDET